MTTYTKAYTTSIPEPLPELADRRCWVVWHLETNDNGHSTKVPYDPTRANGPRASTTDPRTWGTYPQAVACLKWNCSRKYNGLGIMFADNLAGVDLDDCRNPDTGEIESWAMQEVERLNSYCEVSPSGTGLHIFAWGKLPGDGINREWNHHKVEMYDRARYFTYTGMFVDPVKWRTIEHRDAEITELYNRVVKATPKQAPKATFKPPILTLSDEEILEHAKANPKFDALYSGSTAAYKSGSEADMALVNLLCYWTPDDEQVRRLWLSSGLYRAKLERADYVTRTINSSRASQTRCNWNTEHCEPEPESEPEPEVEPEPLSEDEDWPISTDPGREKYLRRVLANTAKMIVVRMMMVKALGIEIPAKAWRLIDTISSFCRGSLRVRRISDEMLAKRAHISPSTIQRDRRKLRDSQRKSGITLIRYWPGSMDLQTGELHASRYQSNLDRWCLMALDQAIQAHGYYPLDEHLEEAVAAVAMTIPRNPVPATETETPIKKEPRRSDKRTFTRTQIQRRREGLSPALDSNEHRLRPETT